MVVSKEDIAKFGHWEPFYYCYEDLTKLREFVKGRLYGVTPLSREGFIEYDPAAGWHLTEKGRYVLDRGGRFVWPRWVPEKPEEPQSGELFTKRQMEVGLLMGHFGSAVRVAELLGCSRQNVYHLYAEYRRKKNNA